MSTQDREPIVDQTSLKPPFWKGRYSESKTGNKTINTRSLGLQEVPNTPAAPCCFSLRNLSSEPIFRMAPSIGKSPPPSKKEGTRLPGSVLQSPNHPPHPVSFRPNSSAGPSRRPKHPKKHHRPQRKPPGLRVGSETGKHR